VELAEVARRYFRELRGSTSVRQFAKDAGLTHQFLSQLESGGRNILVNHIQRLAAARGGRRITSVLEDMLRLAREMERDLFDALPARGATYERKDAVFAPAAITAAPTARRPRQANGKSKKKS
jgi:transcriptional regulator with XRE-family HTH domain